MSRALCPVKSKTRPFPSGRTGDVTQVTKYTSIYYGRSKSPSQRVKVAITSRQMGAIDEKLESTSTKAVNSDTESTTRSIIPPLQQIVEPVPDVAGALNSPTRSRRPTLVKDPLELFPQPWRSVDSVLEPAASEKWTANRIANASWAYITTWKVSLLSLQQKRHTNLGIGILNHFLYA